MARPREHVHGLRPGEAIAPPAQALDVPGEGGGIAGDVGDCGDAGVGEGVQQRGVRALAGRIEYGGVKATPLVQQPRNLHGGVAADEVGPVVEAVARGVALRVGDGGRDDLDACGASGPPRRGQGDRTRAAVGVQHVQVAAGAYARGFQRRGVQALGLVRVDLEEGLGGEGELKAHQPVRQ